MIKGIIIDFNWTIYSPEINGVSPGAIEIMQKLHGKYKLALLSSRISGISEAERREQIHDLGIELFFEEIMILPKEKTMEDMRECMRRMGLKSEEMMVIGDRIISEITIGNQLGCVTVWYRQGKFANVGPENAQQKPRYTINHFNELLSLLNKFQKH